MAVDAEGRITAIDIDDLTGIGPYSVYPRTSAVEGNQVVNLVGGPYDFANYRAKTTVVLPEQDADLPVPRRRPPDRHARSPRAWSISPPRRSGSIPSSSAAAT